MLRSSNLTIKYNFAREFKNYYLFLILYLINSKNVPQLLLKIILYYE